MKIKTKINRKVPHHLMESIKKLMAAGNISENEKLRFLIYDRGLFILSKYKEGGFILNTRAKEQRNIYMKEWREKNKDKVKAAQDRYWEKKFNEKEKEQG